MSNAVDIRNRAAHVPPSSQAFNGQIPVRFEGAPEGPFEGDTRWFGVERFEHAELCRRLQLDPVRFYFDLPSSIRGIGAQQQGHGGGASARLQSGFVFMAGRDRPVGKLTVCRAGERHGDVDPLSSGDFESLDRY
jgi:hypothetical protein